MSNFESGPSSPGADSIFGQIQHERDRRYFEAFVPAYKALSEYENSLLGNTNAERISVQEYDTFVEHPTEINDRAREKIDAALTADGAFFRAHLAFMLKTGNLYIRQVGELFTYHGHTPTAEDIEEFDLE